MPVSPGWPPQPAEVLNDIVRWLRSDLKSQTVPVLRQLGVFETLPKVSWLEPRRSEPLRSGSCWCVALLSPGHPFPAQDLLPLLIEYAGDKKERKLMFTLLRLVGRSGLAAPFQNPHRQNTVHE